MQVVFNNIVFDYDCRNRFTVCKINRLNDMPVAVSNLLEKHEDTPVIMLDFSKCGNPKAWGMKYPGVYLRFDEGILLFFPKSLKIMKKNDSGMALYVASEAYLTASKLFSGQFDITLTDKAFAVSVVPTRQALLARLDGVVGYLVANGTAFPVWESQDGSVIFREPLKENNTHVVEEAYEINVGEKYHERTTTSPQESDPFDGPEPVKEPIYETDDPTPKETFSISENDVGSMDELFVSTPTGEPAPVPDPEYVEAVDSAVDAATKREEVAEETPVVIKADDTPRVGYATTQAPTVPVTPVVDPIAAFFSSRVKASPPPPPKKAEPAPPVDITWGGIVMTVFNSSVTTQEQAKRGELSDIIWFKAGMNPDAVFPLMQAGTRRIVQGKTGNFIGTFLIKSSLIVKGPSGYERIQGRLADATVRKIPEVIKAGEILT